MDGSCSCVVPCYNEEDHIGSVLEVVTKIKNIEQVICIDDGSTDNTAAFIEKNYPQVLVVRLKTNQGKAAAVLKGANAAKSGYVLLMDADLKNLNQHEITRAISKVVNDPRIDMIILRREKDPWLVKLFRGDIITSGQRILRREELLEILKDKPIRRYQLEVAINQYMMENKKAVYWLPLSAVAPVPLKKLGLLAALRKEIKMYLDIFSYLGPIDYARQVLTFCHQRA